MAQLNESFRKIIFLMLSICISASCSDKPEQAKPVPKPTDSPQNISYQNVKNVLFYGGMGRGERYIPNFEPTKITGKVFALQSLYPRFSPGFTYIVRSKLPTNILLPVSSPETVNNIKWKMEIIKARPGFKLKKSSGACSSISQTAYPMWKTLVPTNTPRHWHHLHVLRAINLNFLPNPEDVQKFKLTLIPTEKFYDIANNKWYKTQLPAINLTLSQTVADKQIWLKTVAKEIARDRKISEKHEKSNPNYFPKNLDKNDLKKLSLPKSPEPFLVKINGNFVKRGQAIKLKTSQKRPGLSAIIFNNTNATVFDFTNYDSNFEPVKPKISNIKWRPHDVLKSPGGGGPRGVFGDISRYIELAPADKNGKNSPAYIRRKIAVFHLPSLEDCYSYDLELSFGKSYINTKTGKEESWHLPVKIHVISTQPDK